MTRLPSAGGGLARPDLGREQLVHGLRIRLAADAFITCPTNQLIAFG